MQSQILLATSNPGKFHELKSALADLPFEFLNLTEFPSRLGNNPPPISGGAGGGLEPIENGKTFAENAQIKAEFWFEKTGLATIADDSGILVDALPSELGVNTVRWGLGKSASDADWLNYFLERLKNVPPEKRGADLSAGALAKAEFVCVLALCSFNPRGRPTPGVVYFEGRVRGIIIEKPEAPLLPGIPLSSVFRPDGSEKVFAALTTAEKEKFSHRGRALAELKKFLQIDPTN
jgi:XTP/dITP diphosphohydrolase